METLIIVLPTQSQLIVWAVRCPSKLAFSRVAHWFEIVGIIIMLNIFSLIQTKHDMYIQVCYIN